MERLLLKKTHAILSATEVGSFIIASPLIPQCLKGGILVINSISIKGYSLSGLMAWNPSVYTLTRMLSRIGLDIITFLNQMDEGNGLYAANPSSEVIFYSNEEIFIFLSDVYRTQSMDTARMEEVMMRSNVYSSRLSTILSFSAPAGLSLKMVFEGVGSRRKESAEEKRSERPDLPDEPISISALSSLHLIARLEGLQDMPDAYYSCLSKYGWNPTFASLAHLLFPLSIDISDFLIAASRDDLVIAPSEKFSGTEYGRELMDTISFLHREQGRSYVRTGKDIDRDRTAVMRAMTRREGELITVGHVMNYIRPLNITLPELLAIHDRRSAELLGKE